MQRDDAALEVGRSAGRIVDDHRDRLALVELGFGALRKDRRQRHQSGDQQNFPYHDRPPWCGAVIEHRALFAATCSRYFFAGR